MAAHRQTRTSRRPTKFQLLFPAPPPGDRVQVAVIYPGPAMEGASSLAIHHLVRLINAHPRGAAEPVFAPSDQGSPRGHVSGRPLSDFDLLAFSLAFEEQWLLLPRLLALAGIPTRAATRTQRHPIVLAGGVACRLNPGPGLAFMDALVPGDAEPVIGPVLEVLNEGLGAPRATLLEGLGRIAGLAVHPFSGPPVQAGWHDSGPPAAQLGGVRGSEFARMFLVETGRGCPAGCRFCALGFSRRPPVFHSTDSILAAAAPGLERGLPIGLVGASLGRHPALGELVERLASAGSDLAPASLDPQVLLSDAGRALADGLHRSHQRSVTLAPEAGTERLRRVINKPTDDGVLPAAVRRLADAGVIHLKLYLMFGLPGEQPEDLDAIVSMVAGAREALLSVHRGRGGTGHLGVSLNPFVPKPHTPFQFSPMPPLAELKRRRSRIASGLRKLGGVSVSGISPRRALLQAWLARADQSLAPLLEACEGVWPPPGGLIQTHAPGWQAAVIEPWPTEREVPWRMIRPGLSTDFLERELHRAEEARATGPCSAPRCPACDACAGLT